MARTIKMCDMSLTIAAQVFQMLNPDDVKIKEHWPCSGMVSLVTDKEPKELVYPEGWYYAKGNFRNKHMSTTGIYHELIMVTTKGKPWRELATYCTLD